MSVPRSKLDRRARSVRGRIPQAEGLEDRRLPAMVGGPVMALTPESSVNRSTDAMVASALDGAGNLVVAWGEAPVGGSQGSVHVQRYDGAGRPIGREIRFNTSGSALNGVDVAANAAGDFVVGYTDGSGGVGSDVHAKLFDASGQPKGVGSLDLSRWFATSPDRPRVAMDAKGDFFVAWTFIQYADRTGAIRGRSFDPAGNPVNEGLALTGTGSGLKINSIAMNSTGEFVLDWAGAMPSNSGQVINHVGRYLLDGHAAASPYEDHMGDGAAIDDDGVVYALTSGDPGVPAGRVGVRRFVPSENTSTLLTVQPNGANPSTTRFDIKADAHGNFALAWSGPIPGDPLTNRVQVERFDSYGRDGGNGTGSANFKESNGRVVGPGAVRLVSNPHGDLAATWVSTTVSGSTSHAAAQRYTFTNTPPTTIGIDDVSVYDAATLAPVSIPLTQRFSDAEDTANLLNYQLVQPLDSWLGKAAISTVGGRPVLQIQLAPGHEGSARVVVRATDSGGLAVDAPFQVTNGANPAAPPALKIYGTHVSQEATVDTVVTTILPDGSGRQDVRYTLTYDSNGLYKLVGNQVKVADPSKLVPGGTAVSIRSTGADGLFRETVVGIDVLAPNRPPAPTLADVESIADQGAFSTIKVADHSPTWNIAGVAEATPVSLYRDGKEVAHRIGTGPIQDPGPVPNGHHSYTVRAHYSNGRDSDASDAVYVNIGDRPPAPSYPVLSDASGGRGGVSPSLSPHVVGRARPGGSIEIRTKEGVLLGTGHPDAKGEYDVELPNLKHGTYNLKARAIGADGFPSLYSDTNWVVAGGTPIPSTPTYTVRDGRRFAEGTATPGVTVEVSLMKVVSSGLTLVDSLVPTQTVGSTVVGADGKYSIELKGLPAGPIDLAARAISADGAQTTDYSLDVAAQVAYAHPTLVILTHGQVPRALVGGVGRDMPPWLTNLHDAIRDNMHEPVGANTKLQFLYVDWSTNGGSKSPASNVAQQVLKFVEDSRDQYDGQPWDILLFGHSRGACFNNVMLNSMNLPAHTDRIGHVHSIMLDPTAVRGSDDYPSVKPPGVEYAYDYDDGYHLTGKNLMTYATLGATFLLGPVGTIAGLLGTTATIDGSQSLSGIGYHKMKVEVDRSMKLNRGIKGLLKSLGPMLELNAHDAIHEIYRTNDDGAILKSDLRRFQEAQYGRSQVPSQPFRSEDVAPDWISRPERDTLFHQSIGVASKTTKPKK